MSFKKILITGLLCALTLSSCAEEGEENTTKESSNTSSSQPSTTTTTSDATSTTAKVEYKPVIGVKGGKRTITSFSPPKTFNYYLAAETSSTDILGQMYAGLVYTDPFTKETKPELAESWEISADKMTYIVKLKKGLLWSDGKPITADDVVFTFNDIINNTDIPTNSRDGMLVEGKFPKVEKVDELTVKFVTPKPFVPFLRNSLSSAIVVRFHLTNMEV
jgi:peptide/nickel transport system substrate-binding protein